MSYASPLLINGWSIIAHPQFTSQIEELLTEVESLRRKNPDNYKKKNATKRLKAIAKLAFESIPEDPTRVEYRQGSTLGNDHKHWFRAKFYQQYRLFFRYHEKSKVIVLAWVNDEDSKRSYGSKSDAYKVFEDMLDSGDPPDDWDKLLEEAQENSTCLQEVINKV
ncbi:MAG: type II toxin-antitoxin system YhaV family toxin [Gammaproteobacteria bacterium]|nr:type II toxin-antitoxin system YhaV family toxin [Gammaproteobacteria bacterium]